jgi:hypothetical protein
MEIKKGNLNFDQTGRAYPDNPHIEENWDCIWEYKGKHYKLVGDDSHKEWEEVQIGKETIEDAAEDIKQRAYSEEDVKKMLHTCCDVLENNKKSFWNMDGLVDEIVLTFKQQEK